MKRFLSFLAFSIILLIGTFFLPQSSNFNQIKKLEIGKTMCNSSPTKIGRCTGSPYCTACKNCRYCKYCNNGGSCGVCGKRAKKRYTPPKPKKHKKKDSPRNKNQRKLYTPPKSPNEYFQPPPYHNNIYTITKKTSLRELGNSRSKVLKRLQAKEEVIVLDSTGKYWWKVKFNNKIGWVKKHLLKKKPPTA